MERVVKEARVGGRERSWRHQCGAGQGSLSRNGSERRWGERRAIGQKAKEPAGLDVGWVTHRDN